MLNTIHDGTKAHPFIGVATIVVKDGLILVGYDGEKNKYSFPGGYWESEKFETFEDAAAREVFEETGGYTGVSDTGIKCAEYKEIYRYTFFRKDKNVWHTSIGFMAKYSHGTPTDDPVEKRTKWTFMPPDEVLKLDLFEPARRGLEIYLKH